MDWWEWLQKRYGETKDYVEGYPDAYFSNVKQGLLQSAEQYKKDRGIGSSWALPFAFSLNPTNVAVGDAITAAAKPIADITGAEQQDVENTLSAATLAFPLIRTKGLSLSGKTRGISKQPLLTYAEKYPLSLWMDMPEWSSIKSVSQRTAAPNPVETFYYSRAVEQARTLSTDEEYPLADIVNWLPGSKVIDQSTGEPGQDLSRYAKDAIKDELQYFGVDQWAQNQIDLGKTHFKPQELLDYLNEQGEIPFRLRTSFAEAPDTGGYDISHDIEWTSEYGNAAAAQPDAPTPTELGIDTELFND